MRSNKNISALALVLIMGSILLPSCSRNFLFDFAERDNPVLAKKIAKANQLAADDITVKTSHFKANYCDIIFHEIPPTGKYSVTPIIKMAPSLIKTTGPLFFHISIPGGNPSAFWDIPSDSLHLTKTGTAPIVFDTISGVTVAKKRELELKKWTMNDLLSLPEKLPVDIIDIKMASQEGFDWLFLKKHPNISALRLSGAAGFIHADKLDSVNCSLVFKNNKNLVFPQKLKCWLFALDGNDVDNELLGRLDPEKLNILQIANCQRLDLSNIGWLGKCSSATFQNCPNMENLSSLTDMPELDSLTIINCPINDASAIKNIPKLRILRLKKTQLTDFSSFRGCKIWFVEIQQETLSATNILKDHIAGIEILDLNNIRIQEPRTTFH